MNQAVSVYVFATSQSVQYSCLTRIFAIAALHTYFSKFCFYHNRSCPNLSAEFILQKFEKDKQILYLKFPIGCLLLNYFRLGGR